jgi:hypothetical protein
MCSDQPLAAQCRLAQQLLLYYMLYLDMSEGLPQPVNYFLYGVNLLSLYSDLCLARNTIGSATAALQPPLTACFA